MYLLKAFIKAKENLPDISIEEGIMNGEPCIRGTRLPVWHIINTICNHYSPLEIKDYPNLNPDQIRQALMFAEKVLRAYNHEKT